MRRTLDLIGKVPARQPAVGEPSHRMALVHLELDSADRAADVRAQMVRDYGKLREAHGLHVLPIVLFLYVAMEEVGVDVHEDYVWDFNANTFRYLYVALKGLDALQYLQGDNMLGVALTALMKVPKDKVAWVGAEALLRRLSEAPISER